MNTPIATILVDEVKYPVSFCYAALEELETLYQLPAAEVLARAASFFGTQTDLVHIGIKHGIRIAKKKQTIERNDVADFLTPQVFNQVCEIFIAAFPQAEETETPDETPPDKKK